MYAIIEAQGKQYRVQEGDILDIDLVTSEEKTLKFNKVLLFHDGKGAHVGSPHVAKCTVHAEVLGETKGPKVIAFKYKPCKNYRRTVGHRQKYSKVKITKIEGTAHGA
ncbi:MAG: 50S ribosomal protein L21 [Chlamydiae bacterium]|nr:50S ribosomal protein L21 [Chlamydiota bacterium]